MSMSVMKLHEELGKLIEQGYGEMTATTFDKPLLRRNEVTGVEVDEDGEVVLVLD